MQESPLYMSNVKLRFRIKISLNGNLLAMVAIDHRLRCKQNIRVKRNEYKNLLKKATKS